MGERKQYRTSTEGSPKWDAGHNVGCCLYAPDDVCACAEFQEAADAEKRAGEEAANQKADMQVVGYGCLLFIALALGIVTWAVCAYRQRGEDDAVAAYSICESCGLVLDADTVHAACGGEVCGYAH